MSARDVTLPGSAVASYDGCTVPNVALHVLRLAWEHATTSGGDPHLVLWAASAGVGAVLVAWAPTWRFARQIVTPVHEAGHAVLARLVGRSVRSINLRRDTSGQTVTLGTERRVRDAAVSFAGYPAPAAVGVLLVLAIASGRCGAADLALAAAAALIVLRVRNLWGVLVLVPSAVALVAVVALAPTAVLASATATLATLLVAGSLRTMSEHRTRRRRHELSAEDLGADVYGVARRLHVPAVLVEIAWRIVWLACCGAVVARVLHGAHL